ncbi:MAG: hypothetical protein ACP5QU_06730, partial [Anaerolineae bacterium]
MPTLKNKIAVVTGSSRGFGYAIAESLLEAGATVCRTTACSCPTFTRRNPMQTKNSQLYLSLWTVVFALTAIVWLTAGGLQARFDVVNEKYYSFFYPWQTRNPTAMAYITSWLG